MTPSEKLIIRMFAEGNNGFRSKALAIHRHYIPILGVRGTLEQRFMAEIDNPSPDLILRARYRKELLEQNYI